MVAADRSKRFAFIFPMASGHVNPSLPVARHLVSLGHEVHYLCREQMRGAIEGTGAAFHSDVENEPEMYEGREPGLIPATSLKKEYGLEDEPIVQVSMQLKSVALELVMQGVLRWLRRIGPDAIMYCPLMNPEAAYAGKVLHIPSVALLTTAGPGSFAALWKELLDASGLTVDDALRLQEAQADNVAALQRLNEAYDLQIRPGDILRPFGYIAAVKYSVVTLVTTIEDLQDPVPEELQQAYQEASVKFETVGSLIDEEGAQRAGCHKFHAEGHSGLVDLDAPSVTPKDVLAQVRAACASGRPVVLVSMGTVITGDTENIGWNGRMSSLGMGRGLTGCELCRSAWAGAFEAFGRTRADDGPLLVVALGPQPDPLGPVTPPANALCMPVIPQVDLLRAGVRVFLTHGGQNSFTEALASGVPVVVCPGFGDQQVNARKAECRGVGLSIPRPDCENGGEAAAVATYTAEVAQALLRVFTEGSFRAAAMRCAEQLAAAGGVPRAAELMLAASATTTMHLGGCATAKEVQDGAVQSAPNFAGA